MSNSWMARLGICFPELNVHIQFCLRQNSGIPFSLQPAPAAEWSSLARQITIPGSFSNQQACLPCLNTLSSILTSSLTNYTRGYKISHPLCGVLCNFKWMLRTSTVEHMDRFMRIIAAVRLTFLLAFLNIIVTTWSLWKLIFFFNTLDTRSAFTPQRHLELADSII